MTDSLSSLESSPLRDAPHPRIPRGLAAYRYCDIADAATYGPSQLLSQLQRTRAIAKTIQRTMQIQR
jgi:hypothetical protein